MADFTSLLENLRKGVKDSDLIARIEEIKRNNRISVDAEPVSVSPPYFAVSAEDLVEWAEEIGFQDITVDGYRPKGYEDEWYLVPRKVITLTKPLVQE